MRNLSILGTIVATSFLTHCGAKQVGDSGTQPLNSSEMLADTSVSSSVFNANYSDAIAALAEQSSGSGVSLTESPKDDDAKGAEKDKEKDKDSRDDRGKFNKICAISGNSAVITVSSAVNDNESKTRDKGARSETRTMTGSSTMTRTWLRTDGTPVVCDASGRAAEIDWSNPDKLQLSVAFERTRSSSRIIVRDGAASQKSESKSESSKGVRTINWSANTSSATAGNVVGNKSIVSSATRDVSIKNSSGLDRSLSMSIKTKSDAPLKVAVERDASKSIVSKTISSGTLVATNATDSRIETVFKDLKISFMSSECKPLSGSVAVSFFSGTDSKPLKTYTLTVSGSDNYSFVDDKGVKVEDFGLDACDAEDLNL